MVLFVLQPCQILWERAREAGDMALLTNSSGLAELGRKLGARHVFLHGPGGSGKTFCMTDVVLKIVRHFFGERGVKAIAATNSAARLLLGKTMHAAGKLARQQSLKAQKLKPNSRVKKALQREWEALVLLLGDELSMAAPALVACVPPRRASGSAPARQRRAVAHAREKKARDKEVERDRKCGCAF